MAVKSFERFLFRDREMENSFDQVLADDFPVPYYATLISEGIRSRFTSQ